MQKTFPDVAAGKLRKVKKLDAMYRRENAAHIAIVAAQHDRRNILRYIWGDVRLNAEQCLILDRAVEKCSLRTLEWLLRHDCFVSCDTLFHAEGNPHLDVVERVKELDKLDALGTSP